MSESYRQCVECGKRALRFATRCPGCGIALPNPAPLEGGDGLLPGWARPLKGLMAVLAIGGTIASLERGPAGPSMLSAETPVVSVGASLAATPRVDTATFATTVATPDTTSVVTRNTTTVVPPVAAPVASPVATPVVAAVAPPAATPATKTAGVLLVIKGRTFVRSHRTVNAKLEAVLTPGDTVVADSLVKGWYRVAMYGDVLGYARQATLAPAHR